MRRRLADLQKEKNGLDTEKETLVNELEEMQRKIHELVIQTQKHTETSLSSEQIYNTMESDYKKLQERENAMQVRSTEHELIQVYLFALNIDVVDCSDLQSIKKWRERP